MARGSSAATKSDSSLQKGQACAYCRRRKMRCDGQRPVCGPCISRPEDCEYLIGQSRTRAEILEEDISRIEKRIYELEHPTKAASSAVFLHNPYEQPNASPPTTSTSPAADAWWDSPEPPIHMVKTLLDAFLPYASDWGFFLDPARFRHDALLSLPIGHHSRPSPALLTAVYLAGIAVSDSTALKAHENTFLSRALSALPVSLSGLHPKKEIHALQTEILLATYFYASGRFLEARYHATATVSLAVSAEVKTRALSSDAGAPESVNACWATVVLDKSWANALALRPNLSPHDCRGMRELPWPDDASPSSQSPRSTVSQFLDGTDVSSGPLSTKMLLAKGTVLWEQANSVVAHWRPDMGPDESTQFSRAFDALDTRIGAFHGKLAPAPAPTPRALLVGRSMAHAAVLQLHSTFARAPINDPTSKQKCLTAAKSILTLAAGIDARECAFINPVVGAIWVAAVPSGRRRTRSCPAARR
ncbi:hypothetical protein FB451DRAFT_782159 [Mycena latifolia]|nr:hypothetical protein FB451DRAFT_782159 [Mycena latifolia]